MRGLRKRVALIMAVVLLLGYISSNPVAVYGMQDILFRKIFSDATPGNATSGNATPGNATSGNATSGNATSGNATSGNATPCNAYIYIYEVLKIDEDTNEKPFVEMQADERSLKEQLKDYISKQIDGTEYQIRDNWYWYTENSDNKCIGKEILGQTFEQVPEEYKSYDYCNQRVILKVFPEYQIRKTNMSFEPDNPMVTIDRIEWYQKSVEIKLGEKFTLKSDIDLTDEWNEKNNTWKFDKTKRYECWIEDDNPYTLDSEKVVFGVDSEGPCIERKATYTNSDSYSYGEWVRGERVYVWKITDIGTGISYNDDIRIEMKSGNTYGVEPELQLMSYDKEQNKYEYELRFSISENDEYTICIKDRAGNDGEQAVFMECNISKEKPSIDARYKDSATPISREDYVNINEDIEVIVHPAKDSGAKIEKVEYRVNENEEILGEFEKDDQGNVVFTINKAEIPEGKNIIGITVEDALRSTAEETYIVNKDVSTPSDASITPKFQSIETEEGESVYLARPGDVIEISARDEYSGFSDKAEETIDIEGGVAPNFIEKVEYQLKDDGKEFVYYIYLKIDETMTEPMVIAPIKCSISDKSGNSIDIGLEERIVIDGAVPKISVSYECVDKYGLKNKIEQKDIDKVLLSNQKITAIVTIEDDHLDYTEAGYEIELVNDITNEKKKVEIFDLNQEAFVQTIRFDIDEEKSGKFHLEIYAKDVAGNNSCYNTSKNDSYCYEIYLDKEAPSLWGDFKGYEGEWTKNSFMFDIYASDDSDKLLNGIESVWYTFTEEKEFEVPSINDVANSEYTKAENVAGKYVLPIYNKESKAGFYHVWAYDASGNSSKKTLSQKVNIDVKEPVISDISFDTASVLELKNGIEAFNTDVDLEAIVTDIDSRVEKIEYQIYDQKKSIYCPTGRKFLQMTGQSRYILIHRNMKQIMQLSK